MAVNLLRSKIIIQLLFFLCFFKCSGTLKATIKLAESERSTSSININTSNNNSFESVLPRSQKKKKRQIRKKRKHRLDKIPAQRLWGIWSTILGGYGIVFFIFSALFFIGIASYWYLFVFFGLAGILGLLLVISGVSNIDQSYITHSENAAMQIERLRPQMWRDFIFAFIFALAIIAMLLLQFYLTAALLFVLVLSLLILGLLKSERIKRLKK